MLVGIPQDEVLLGQRLPALEAGDIGVGIFFLVPFLRNFSDRYLEAHLGGQPAIGEHELLSSSELLSILWRVAVGDKTQGAAEPAEIRELLLAPDTTERGNDIGDAKRLEAHHIGCSLDKIDLANLSGCLHGHINAEDRGALLVNQAVTAIEVLDRGLRVNASGSECLHASPAVSLGDHQTATVEVIVVAGTCVVLTQQSHFGKDLQVQAFRLGILEELVAIHRTIAQSECAAELLVPTACAAIGKLGVTAAGGCFLTLCLILAAEEFLCVLIVHIHGFRTAVFLLLFRRTLLKEVVGIDIWTVGVQQPAYRIDEAKSLTLLHKGDNITTFAAAETLITVQGQVEHQGWGALLVEDTAALPAMRAG